MNKNILDSIVEDLSREYRTRKETIDKMQKDICILLKELDDESLTMKRYYEIEPDIKLQKRCIEKLRSEATAMSIAREIVLNYYEKESVE